MGAQERIQERKNENGHLTVDQVSCIFGQQDLRYRWDRSTSGGDIYPDPEDGGEVCQVPHVDCPTGQNRDLREIMSEVGKCTKQMPGTIIVPLDESGREIYGQSPALQVVKIQKGEYLSFDGDWVHGGVSKKPPNKEMCPAIHIHIDSKYFKRRKDTIDLDTRVVERAIYVPKEHLPFRNLVSLMNVMQKRSKDLRETVGPVFDKFSALERRQQKLEELEMAAGQDPIGHGHNLRSTKRGTVGLSGNEPPGRQRVEDDRMDEGRQRIEDDRMDDHTEASGTLLELAGGAGCDSDDDHSFPQNRKRLRVMMYKLYKEQLDVTTDMAEVVTSLGKPVLGMEDKLSGMDIKEMKALHRRALNTVSRKAKTAGVTSPSNKSRSSLDTASTLIVLQGGGVGVGDRDSEGANPTYPSMIERRDNHIL